jgi:chemosensory pili system protein ChpA (sensor histidine kinase/response regulator)
MRLQDDLDFTTLNWVKQELDETLKQARQALEAYVEDPADSSLMRFCATYLHQVQGTLRMVELYGASMVVEEMERVANALLDNQVRQKEEAYAVLMRGIVQLPDYLERLQSGHKDIPIVLLPLLNDLRACRGEKLLSESVLFSPDLSAPLPSVAAGPSQATPDLELKALAGRLRNNYQAGLLHWFRDKNATQSIAGLVGTLDRLRTITAQDEARRLWWVAAGVLDAVHRGGIEASVALKLLFGRVDREIKRMADAGEGSFRVEPPRELVKNLLYYAAHTEADTERLRELRQTYRLDALLPSAQELDHAKGSLAGKNRALLDTVSSAIKEDLMRVKDALDLHLRTMDAKPAELAAQTEVLDRVADTLGMLGLGVPRRVVQEQRGALMDISSGARPADESALLDIAGALLYVEASLDDNIETLGGGESAAGATPTAENLELPQAEVRKILEALIKEASVNLQQAKQDIVAFVESPWDHAKVAQIPRLLEEISGALRMLNLGEPAELIEALVRFVEVELIRLRRVPTSEQMDRLADSLASVEYYLEAARDQRAGREKILDVTRRSLEALGYWPVPEAALLPDIGTGLDEVAGASLEQAPPPSVRASAPASAPATPPPTTATTIAPPPPASAMDVTGLSFGTPTQTRSEAFRVEDTDLGAGDELPTIDLGGDDVDDFIARMERGESAPEPAPQPSPSFNSDTHELIAAVDIAAGRDLGDLIVGESAAAPVSPPPAHDVAGLRFAETEAARSETAEHADEFDYEWVEIEEEVEVDAPAGEAVSAEFQSVQSDDIDDSIREVFVEEVQDEIENLGTQVPGWKRDPQDLEKLKPIRRSFHTLKGSGRLVGAMALGEFSWKVENMLNRVLDKTIQPNAAVVALLDHAVAALPHMLSALRGEGAPRADIAGIMTVADKLAAGEDAWLKSAGRTRVKQTRRVRVAKPRLKPAPAPFVETPQELEHTFNITETLKPEPEIVTVAATSPIAIPGAASALADAGAHMPMLDPMLLEILRSEVEGHLATLNEYLAVCDTRGAQPIDEGVLRAVHTMHGAISMAEVPVISDVVGPLEGYVKRLRGSGLPPSAAGLGVLRDCAALVGTVLGKLDQPGAALPGAHDVIARLDALRGQLPEPESAFSVFDLALEDEAEAAPSSGAPAAPDDLGMMVEETELTLTDLPPHDEVIEAQAQAATAVLDDGEFSDLALDAATTGAFDALDTPAVTLAEPPASTVEDALIALESTPGFDAEIGTELVAEETKIEPEAFVLDEFFAESEPAAVSEPAPISASPAPMEPVVVAPAVEAPTSDAAAVRIAMASVEDPDPEGALELPDMDEDLIEIFVEEGSDILDKADALVARLRESPTEQEAIVGLQRHLHTLKGNARAVGISGVGDLSHVMESLIEGVVGEHLTLNRTSVEALERGFDRLHHLVSRVSRRQAVGMPTNTIAMFEALVAGEHFEPAGVALDRAVPPAAAVPAPAAPVRAPEPTPEPVAPAKPAARAPIDAPIEEETVSRAPQEMIRVRSDLLDALVNFAGEVSIYRSRLEQQIGTFRFNLVELDQTTLRLREQLRKLEMETEAQILSRYQREAEQSGEGAVFDPLELDRFSTLQQLSRALAESVSDLISLQNAMDDLTRQSETLLLQQSRVSSELQEGLMRTRMVPFDSVVPFLRRLLRQTADELGKRAALRIEGAQGEMDRNLLERMKAPFEHMLRNALAHGIESPEDRERAGKSADGQVRITVSREATEVVIRVSDDGKGMDRDAIRRKAIERGLLRPDAQLSDRDLFGFVLETGFSTAEQVTKISGRGVGMDVVASEIKQLGGSLSIDSQRGRGTEFIIRLPFTLAVTQAILVRVGEQTFAVPMSSVQGVARITREELDRRLREPNPAFNYAGEEYAIHELHVLLNVPPHRLGEDVQLPMLLARTGDQRAAVRVDSVLGSREVVVKSVGPQVSSVPGVFGATIMGDGSVVMILDLAPLIRRSAALREEFAVESALEDLMPGRIVETVAAAPTSAAMPEARRQPVVMVVDDSITMRKVTSRVLERHDMEVITAKDGLDAVEKLQDRIPDLVLLDIEMPRMDGYELATYMRNDPRLRTVPIIMITSRTGEKHRQRAFEIGVDRYLGKPYQEADLLRNVEETLRLSRALH